VPTRGWQPTGRLPPLETTSSARRWWPGSCSSRPGIHALSVNRDRGHCHRAGLRVRRHRLAIRRHPQSPHTAGSRACPGAPRRRVPRPAPGLRRFGPRIRRAPLGLLRRRLRARATPPVPAPARRRGGREAPGRPRRAAPACRLAYHGRLLATLGRTLATGANLALPADRRRPLPAEMSGDIRLGPFIVAGTLLAPLFLRMAP
jgi:hypothetical protein